MNTKIGFLGSNGSVECDIDTRTVKHRNFETTKYLVTVDWAFHDCYNHGIMATLTVSNKSTALYALGRIAIAFDDIDRNRDITWLDVLRVCENVAIEGMIVEKF